MRHNFFLNRATFDWNRLNNSQVNVITVKNFKAKVDNPGPSDRLA